MATTTIDISELRDLIQPTKLQEQGLPRPKRVVVAAAPDHTGDDSYFVYLVFPNATPDGDLAWGRIKRLVEWVWETIWKADGERHWPYVQVKRERDMKGEPV